MSKILLFTLVIFYLEIGQAQISTPTLNRSNISLNNFLPQIIKSIGAPDNPNNILLSVYGWNAHERAAQINTYSSFDGGKTFQLTLKDNSTQWVSEVSNAFGLNNNCYVVTGASKRSGKLRGHTYGHMHLYHSSDGGKIWENTVTSNFIDWTSCVADNSNGQFMGRLYISGYDIANDSGGWVGPRKPLLYSTNNGVSLSKPLLTGNWPDNGGGYPLSSKVNKDGALYILFKRNNPNALIIGKSIDGGKTLELSKPVPKDSSIKTSNIFESSFDIDKDGTLYITYFAIYNGRSGILLMDSNDEGITWKHKFISDDETSGHSDLGLSSLSISPTGTIGLFWYDPINKKYKFSYSLDKGNSFKKIVEVSKSTIFEYSNSQFLEKYLQTMGTFEPDDDSKEKRSEVGLSVRLLPFYNALSLSPDFNGNFHLFWTEQESDGTPHLYTTIIDPEEKPTIKNIKRIDTKDFVEINNKIFVDVISQSFDANELTLDFVLTNKSDETFHGPLYIEFEKFLTGYGFDSPVLMNYDTLQSENNKPVIDLTNYISDKELKPDSATSIYRISFKIQQVETTEHIWEKVQDSGETIHPLFCKFNIFIKKNNGNAQTFN